MAPKNCMISLSNYKDTYKPGDTVIGAVICNFDEPTTVRAIYITLIGLAKVSWDESDSDNSSTTYHAEEEYFNAKIILANPKQPGETINMPPGEYNYPFQYTLPIDIPSTIVHTSYNITYDIKATVDRPWAIDYTAKVRYNVVKPIDMSKMPYLMQPAQHYDSKAPKVLFVKTGVMEVFINIPKGGYLPGEQVPIGLDFRNNSSTNIGLIKVKLQREVEYMSKKPSTRIKYDTETLVKTYLEGLKKDTKRTYSLSLLLPRDLRVASLEPCQIIKLTHIILVEGDIPGIHRNFKSKMPIVVGNIPFKT